MERKSTAVSQTLTLQDSGSVSFDITFDPGNFASLFSKNPRVEVLMGESKFTGNIESAEEIGEEVLVTITDVREVK